MKARIMVYGHTASGKSRLLKRIAMGWEKAGLRVAHVDFCRVYIDNKMVGDVCQGLLDIGYLDPERQSRFEKSVFSVLGLVGLRYHGGAWYTFDPDVERWVPIKELSLGERRAMGIMLAALAADAVVIEALDAGMYPGLLTAMISWLTEAGTRAVAAETHTGLALAVAATKGWTAIVMEEGRVLKVARNVAEFRDPELFQREVEAMGLLV